ncbi:hypothetical protein M378DRAFT_866007 [Amanita muscaria Koide BX008]|uniref:Uncharacterized protein n=1 Tax=Amanita muscaria (strain Koide BX008) TaxID=946122 RepID=A0A0C2WWD3_AMAMK|nr:hypothetical protein M378DRAFT_866007 [Amanita muscaria Koide BX008]
MNAGESAAIMSFAHTLLYGIYLTSLGHCLRWLMFETEGWKLRPRIHWPTVTVTLFLFILSTSNAAVVLWMALVATGGQGASAYNATFAWSAGLGTAVLLVVDAVLIYRCWLVYLKTWPVIVFPLVLWLADLVSGIIGLVLLAPNSPWLSSNNLNQYILNDDMTFLVCEIVINVYVTSAIVIQILRVSRWNNGQTSGAFHEIGRILAESGFLFTVTCVVNLLFKMLALSAARFQIPSFIMGSININTATIAFNLVLIRMAQERPHVVTNSEGSNQQPILTTCPFGASESSYNTTQDESMIPDIEMQVTSLVTKAEDSTLDI